IEPGSAEKNAAPDQAGIPVSVQLDHRLAESDQTLNVRLVDIRIRGEMHAAEFIEREALATPANPNLPEEDGTGRDYFNPAVNEQGKERDQWQCEQYHCHVGEALPGREG
ncbi:MAG: hypothetical protein V4819_17030, partial [Verrucomicrobiota bacterium]